MFTREIPLTKTTETHVAEAFIDNWIIPYGSKNIFLSDNGPQFVSRFSESICVFIGSKKLKTTAYQAQTSG